MPSILLLMALLFVAVALKILLTRKPLLMTSRWLFAFMCLAFLPTILNSFFLKGMPITTPAMFGVLLIFFWFQMKGYMAFGVSDVYFRDALLACIKSLGYTIEESMSRIRIIETGDEFQVSIQGWVGSAQIRPTRKCSSLIMGNIIKGMKQYFAETPGRMNYTVSYLYLVIGFLMVCMTVNLFLMHHNIKH
jgi:hypothetical protein